VLLLGIPFLQSCLSLLDLKKKMCKSHIKAENHTEQLFPVTAHFSPWTKGKGITLLCAKVTLPYSGSSVAQGKDYYITLLENRFSSFQKYTH
jgi:hypothetical protein